MVAAEGALSSTERSIASLELAETAAPGIAGRKGLKQPLLFKALILIAAYSCYFGTLQYLFYTKRISPAMYELVWIAPFLFFIIGGLFITGMLTLKRAAAAILCLVIAMSWSVITDFHQQLKIFKVIFSAPLFIWWLWKEPDMLEKLGIRRKHLASDVITAFILSAVVLMYLIFSFKAYNLSTVLKAKDVVQEVSSSAIYMIVFVFMYMVWRRMNESGMSGLDNIKYFAATTASFQAPFVCAFILSGKVGIGLALAGFLMNVLLYVLVTSLTFGRFRNVFPATGVLIVLMILFRAAGIK